MPTEDTSTQVDDASTDAHQTQGEQDAQAHPDSEKEGESTFDARRAFDAANEKVNKLTKKIESFDKTVAEVAKRLGITKEEAKKEVQKDSGADVEAIVRRNIWLDKNAERISAANKEGKYDQYIEEGLKPEHALRLAEQDAGIIVDTSEHDRQKKASPASASVDRSGSAMNAPRDYEKYGLTGKDIEKYGEKAKQVVIHR